MDVVCEERDRDAHRHSSLVAYILDEFMYTFFRVPAIYMYHVRAQCKLLYDNNACEVEVGGGMAITFTPRCNKSSEEAVLWCVNTVARDIFGTAAIGGFLFSFRSRKAQGFSAGRAGMCCWRVIYL